MPPKRRNKSNSARSAAIQAVRRRQGDEGSFHDFHHQYNNNRDDASDEEDGPFIFDEQQAICKAARNDFHLNKDTSDYGDDDEDGCLHCHVQSNDIQVHCDECQSYICQTCHWCHEFQANHEIRVCDRCDAFYCRHCDEMDQCDDCGEVVCASCSTLLSCKFCGGGLCEDCATACGRCGIVLCSRDAKFAVDCDTCKLSYCLVCLASGSKDPCVRCGHRPSKRMEQLVHLRLKSIYKAFKQSSSSSQNKNQYNHHSSKSSLTIEELDDNDEDYGDVPDLEVDNSILLAAAAAKNHASNYMNSARHYANDDSKKDTQEALAERYILEKEKADAAAEALLAELDEEEEAQKSKKSKKKKKKERQQAAKREEERKREQEQKAKEERNSKSKSKQKDTSNTFNGEGNGTSRGKKENGNATSSSNESIADDRSGDEEDDIAAMVANEAESPKTPKEEEDVETTLVKLVEVGNIEGIEKILFTLKGVPGRAALRKNAKKALKRLRSSVATEVDDEIVNDVAKVSVPSTVSKDGENAASGTGSTYKGNSYNYKNDFVPNRNMEGMVVPTTSTGELLKVVSDTINSKLNRAECVMQMSPSVVGWVIGKGGQRIRDLMEESGAKVWIDQEKAKPQECRNVYVSGERKSVDMAVQMVKDIVAKAPVGQQLQQQRQEAAMKTQERPLASTRKSEENASTHNSNPKQISPLSKPVTSPHKNMENNSGLSTSPLVLGAKPTSQAAVSPTPNIENQVVNEDVLSQHVLTCEARFVPLLIGKRGWTIKSIQDESGARVDIDQTVTPRKIKISGSRTNVDTAIAMVRDVLSYPHAQLQQQQQQQQQSQPRHIPVEGASGLDDRRAANSAERAHSPPPSLAIIAGDAKSSVSASSSLSSTPEPSMTSTSKNYPLHTGPLIPPPDYVTANPNSNVPSTQNTFLPTSADVGAPPRRFGGDQPFLLGMQHHMPGMVPSVQQSQHPLSYNPGPTPRNPPMPTSTFPPGIHHQSSAQLEFGMPGARSNGPAPGLQQNMMPGPSANRFNQYNGMGVENTMQNMLPNESTTVQRGPRGLWNAGNGGNHSTAYQGNGAGAGAGTLPMFQNSQQQPNAPFSSLGEERGGSKRDDSRMIDDLFANLGNVGGANGTDQNLLTGLNGLSINNDDLGASSGGGLWGTSSLSDWNYGAANNGTTQSSKNNPIDGTLLSGLQSRNPVSQEASQHPTESRFAWNSTNA